MANLFTSVNHNSQDVEEGQLPPDKHQQSVISLHANSDPPGTFLAFFNPSPLTQLPVNRTNGHSHPEQESSSGQIVLEVVDDQFYSKRKTKKVEKPPNRSKNHPNQRDRERGKEKLYHEKGERDRRGEKSEQKGVLPPEREEPSAAESRIKSTAKQTPYYPPYGYPPPPSQAHGGQYPPMYPPYPYNMPPYQHYPPHTQHVPPQGGNHAPYTQRNMPSQQQLSQYPGERQVENAYKIAPPPPQAHPSMYNYPGYPMGYPPYDYYERQREAQQREEQQRASRKREYMQQLRTELRRNVKDFNNDESLQILEAAKCILKFQDHRPSISQSPSSNITEAPPQHHDIVRDSIAQRAYQRSLQRVEKWLQGDNPNIREFMKGLLEAMQMGDVILKIKQLKLTRKMQQERMQSETKRLLDMLVRDPKKMIF